MLKNDFEISCFHFLMRSFLYSHTCKKYSSWKSWSR